MSIAAVLGALVNEFEGRLETDRKLARSTTYRLGGAAALYAEPAGSADLEALAASLKAHGGGIPILALGRGSNLVVSDGGWPGVVVHLGGDGFSWIRAVDEGPVPGLESGAGRSLPLLANWASRRGLEGAEFFVAIPGSVGGAVRMNAGAHGRSLADCLVEAHLFDFDTLTFERRDTRSLELAYRYSNLTDRQMVVDARLRLQVGEPEVIRERMDEYRRHRALTQPPAVQNAGSVFKNPPGERAGRLVEAAGLKGFRVGGAAVSMLHANFFVTDESATAQDVFDLVMEVRRRIFEGTGIELSPEIRFVGEFRHHTHAVDVSNEDKSK